MHEHHSDYVHTEHAVLDIGGDVGALIIHCRPEWRGREIEVSPPNSPQQRTHTAVLERRANGRPVFAALFLALPAGDYVIWENDTEPMGEVTIVGGEVAEVELLLS
jgi:hypothetical protein